MQIAGKEDTGHTNSGAKVKRTQNPDSEIVVNLADDLGGAIGRKVCFLKAVARIPSAQYFSMEGTGFLIHQPQQGRKKDRHDLEAC